MTELVLWMEKPELNPMGDGFISYASEFDHVVLEYGTQNLFPEVTFENSPQKVSLVLVMEDNLKVKKNKKL